jgi:hypothetical protein
MKKILFICSILMLTSCVKHSYEYVKYQDSKEATFESDFNSTFGVSQSIYKNHKWGMDAVPLVVEKAGTRGVDANGNEWASKGYVVPSPITKDELAKVLEVFNQKGAENYTSDIDWDCYFVQQVYKGTATYKNHDGGTVTGSDHMDWLCTVTTKKMEVVCWWPYEEKLTIVNEYNDHINNFNAGKNDSYNGIMLMTNTDSYKFGFKSSEDNSHVFYNFRMEKIDGNYYVGFDFEANGQNKNEQVDRDFIYNDWIVKIVPGNGVTNTVERVRIMCEDLGGIRSDFDYNDVVFDIKFIKSGDVYKADIMLQAAGGELPLFIGGYEVHELFGEESIGRKYPLINTGDGPSCEPVHFVVDLDGEFSNAWDAINSLPVAVVTDGQNVVHLTINPGSPAEMFAVPTSVEWPSERESIKGKYPEFVNWIRDPSVIWYE